MGRFNLSEWALKNRALVAYALVVLAILGVFSYQKLGQSEDPPFTFKIMVVRTYWPGATAVEVSEQVTDRIEKTIMGTGKYQFVRSFSRPGESLVMLIAKDSMVSSELPALWYQVRKRVGDIKPTLPKEVVGPFFNDEFGDTFGNIYALQGSGFDYATLKDFAERIELELHRVEDVAKVDLLGLQEEKIWVEVSNEKLASLGIPLASIQQAIEQQNSVTPVGFFETTSDRVRLRVSGQFKSVAEIDDFPIHAGGVSLRLGDIAEIHRGFSDPAAPRVRFMGQDAIGIAVSMRDGGDIIALGERLEKKFAEIQETLPRGMTLGQVANQPQAVKQSVGEFIRVLTEAIIVVLIVCFASLGMRSGLVVALSIPLVLAMTFAAMAWFGIGLHKISLGALILALGLLVDDAIIAIEMMQVKMEQGFDRLQAAAFTYKTTAFPMLTGTLVTAAGFLPIATAASSTGEYTRSIFQVVVIALLLSWIVAVVFIPYLGDRLLPSKGFGTSELHEDSIYQTSFYSRFRSWVRWCVDNRKTVILTTVLLFVGSLMMFRFVPQQFFPSSTRLELMVDLELAEGASLEATQRVAQRFEALINGHKEVTSYVAYVGTGSPRFYLPLDQKLPQTNLAQFVITTPSIEARESLMIWLRQTFRQKFSDVQGRVVRLENGPPVGFPVQFRVSGEHIERVREIAREVAAVMREHPHTQNVNLDWDEPSKVIRLTIDQDRARAMGVNSQTLANFLSGSLSGLPVSTFRDKDELIEIRMRGSNAERSQIGVLGSLSVPTANGQFVALSHIAKLEIGTEEGVIWRRNRLPTIIARADVSDEVTPPTVTADLLPKLQSIRNRLPPGYLLEAGGTVEDATRGAKSVAAGMPLFLLVVISLLMIQLRSFSRVMLVLATAPLGLIGVTWFLLIPQVPFGFVAMLGTIALAGMIMRNSVILVDQIERDISQGRTQYEAIIEATVRRFRPIVLTALAAVLAMIPLSRSVFFGPMAVAIMGGLIVATALTLLFLPALYAAWFRVPITPRAPRY